jgi:hypothetical protein
VTSSNPPRHHRQKKTATPFREWREGTNLRYWPVVYDTLSSWSIGNYQTYSNMPSKRTNLFRANLSRSSAAPEWRTRPPKPEPKIRLSVFSPPPRKTVAQRVIDEEARKLELHIEAQKRIEEWFRNPIGT